MMPKALPDAPLGARARQCHADADVDTPAVIVAPTNIAMRKRLMIAPLFYELRYCQRSAASDVVQSPQFSSK
jgi:hypothetical protein